MPGLESVRPQALDNARCLGSMYRVCLAGASWSSVAISGLRQLLEVSEDLPVGRTISDVVVSRDRGVTFGSVLSVPGNNQNRRIGKIIYQGDYFYVNAGPSGLFRSSRSAGRMATCRWPAFVKRK